MSFNNLFFPLYLVYSFVLFSCFLLLIFLIKFFFLLFSPSPLICLLHVLGGACPSHCWTTAAPRPDSLFPGPHCSSLKCKPRSAVLLTTLAATSTQCQVSASLSSVLVGAFNQPPCRVPMAPSSDHTTLLISPPRGPHVSQSPAEVLVMASRPSATQRSLPRPSLVFPALAACASPAGPAGSA